MRGNALRFYRRAKVKDGGSDRIQIFAEEVMLFDARAKLASVNLVSRLDDHGWDGHLVSLLHVSMLPESSIICF